MRGSVSPSPGQGLGYLEMPLKRFVTQNTPYNNGELRLYAVHAIRMKEITFKTINDVPTPTISNCVLNSCREKKMSQKKKKRLLELEAHLGEIIREPGVREKAESKGRKVSETHMNSRETRSKSSRRTSPKLVSK